MKHTLFSPVAAVCLLAASSIFTPALAWERSTLETVAVGPADNTGRRVRIMRVYTMSFTSVQTGSEDYSDIPGVDTTQPRQSHQDSTDDTEKDSSHNHIPNKNTNGGLLFQPAIN